MAEDWDLYAVVRGCRSSTATESSPTATIIPSTTSSRDTSLSCLATLSFKEENDPFSFPSLIKPRTNGFQELNQLFTPFIPTTTTPTTSGFSIYLNSAFPNSADAGSIGQQQHQPALPAASHTSTRPHFMPEASTSGFERFHDQLQQQPQQVQQPQQQQQNQNQLQQFQVPQRSDSAMTLPNTQAVQTPRSRKRKSQQKRMVCHVTAENLSADLWAWRKYGQKPIKGSPYPRNYYRCSSSKGCVARKQVERSTTEPDTFIVTYSGDHTHPRPTHRNSLAGSTRNKPSTTLQPASHGSGSSGNITNRASSSSQLSPTTPFTAPAENEEGADDPVPNKEVESPDQDDEKDMASDDDILIPNMTAMMDNIFLGVHQFGSGTGGGEGGDRSVFVNPTEGSSSNSQPELTPAPWSYLSNYGRPSPG